MCGYDKSLVGNIYEGKVRGNNKQLNVMLCYIWFILLEVRAVILGFLCYLEISQYSAIYLEMELGGR